MSGSPATPLAEALAHGVLPLDGGLSNQLEAQGCDLSDDLWSARLLAEGPEEIEAAHAAYVRAGARVLITSSYQASFGGFARRGATAGRARELFRRSVELARAAAARAPASAPVWVAGSVGPYGAVLADGSEYRGRYGLSVAELTDFHRPRVAALAEAGPDVLALETVPDMTEAEALLRAAEGCGVPVWLSYTVSGARTRAGQPLDDAFTVAAGNDQVIAVGVNCVRRPTSCPPWSRPYARAGASRWWSTRTAARGGTRSAAAGRARRRSRRRRRLTGPPPEPASSAAAAGWARPGSPR